MRPLKSRRPRPAASGAEQARGDAASAALQAEASVSKTVAERDDAKRRLDAATKDLEALQAKLTQATSTAEQQTALVAAQKQQVRSVLQSQGITDSTILAAQDQQIDNNAAITRQNLLDQRFATGNAAYDEWLKSTTAGQQTLL